MAATLRVVKGAKAAKFEVALADTGYGLRRVQALVEELNNHVCDGTLRGSAIRTALVGEIASEVDYLVEEIISDKVKIPALT